LRLQRLYLHLAEVGLMVEEARDPEGNPNYYNRLDELNDQVKSLSSQVVSLTERVARLEEDNKWLKRQLEELNRQFGDLNKRTWLILTSILTTMGGVIAILIRLAIIH
jgi:predicted  nucleic acid-binding Zn-ribbon protein